MATCALPKAPLSPPAPSLSATTTPMSCQDVARGFDLLTHFLTVNSFGQSMLHPDDMAEIRAIANRVRNSKNDTGFELVQSYASRAAIVIDPFPTRAVRTDGCRLPERL